MVAWSFLMRWFPLNISSCPTQQTRSQRFGPASHIPEVGPFNDMRLLFHNLRLSHLCRCASPQSRKAHHYWGISPPAIKIWLEALRASLARSGHQLALQFSKRKGLAQNTADGARLGIGQDHVAGVPGHEHAAAAMLRSANSVQGLEAGHVRQVVVKQNQLRPKLIGGDHT